MDLDVLAKSISIRNCFRSQNERVPKSAARWTWHGCGGFGTRSSGRGRWAGIIENQKHVAVARTSAEGVAQAIHTDMTQVNRLRFASAKRMSLELAKTISGDSYRAAAPRHIIELCMTANDVEASRILLQGIQSKPIREELLLTYPTQLL